MAAPILSRDAAAAEFADRSAIATNLARHSRGVDRNDRTLLTSAYMPDATVAYGMFEGAAAEFAAFLTQAMEGAPATLHRTGNMTIRVEGNDARSESSVIAYTRTPDPDGPGTQRLIGGRYLDRHARHDGGWRIAHRSYVMDWNLNIASREGPGAGGLFGAQREADPAHAWFSEAAASPAAAHQEGYRMNLLDAALARQALHDLVVANSRGVDRGDEAMVAATFHADADVDSGGIAGNGPAYARDVVAMVRGHLRSCFHSLANEYFEVTGDRARGETYVIAHLITLGDAPQETLTGGRYLDRFERRDGHWAISARRFVQDWSMTQPVSMETDGMYEELTTRGGWAPNDPSIAFWNNAG